MPFSSRTVTSLLPLFATTRRASRGNTAIADLGPYPRRAGFAKASFRW